MEHAKKIMVVDDDPLIARMYQHKLEADGYAVVLAVNGEEAIVRAKRERPDLILLDLMMPKMNGVEALKALREDTATRAIPVLIMTNLPGEDKRVAHAKGLGAHGYLVKAETDLKALSDKVAAILRG